MVDETFRSFKSRTTLLSCAKYQNKHNLSQLQLPKFLIISTAIWPVSVYATEINVKLIMNVRWIFSKKLSVYDMRQSTLGGRVQTQS